MVGTMLTGIRSVLGRLQRKKPDDPEEALEDSKLSPEERGPPLLVLISTGAVLSFQLHSFAEAESAAQFIQSRFPPGMKQGIFAFWAIQTEPQQPPDAELRRTNDAVVLLRDPARPGVVELISCVDMAAAQSLVRGEVREGLDLSLVMVYWAMPVAIETDENGIYRLSPSAPPPIVSRAAPAEVVTEQPVALQVETSEAEVTIDAPVVEEALPTEVLTEEEPAAPPEADAEATIDAPVVEEALPAEVVTEEEPAAPPEAEAEATIDAPVVEKAPPAEVVTEEEPAAPQEAEAEAAVDAPVVEKAPPAEVVTEEEPAAPQEAKAVGVTGPKVIIVDPNEAGRTELQKTLAPSSIAVVGRTDYGKEAIALAGQSRPDVLIVAMEEPVARAVRMVESLADLLPQSPIVVYSSIKDFGNIRRAMLAGAKDYLITPVSGEELVRSVHTVLAQEERRGQRLSGEAEEPETAGKVITIFGAKGGIGKTTIATNLAAAIAHETRESVVLIDLDPRFGDVGILLDIPVERSIADLALPEEEVTKELIQDSLYVHSTGVKILAAPLRPTDWRDVNPRHIERVVTVLAQTYDYVILDTPGTFNDIVMRALELANAILLVTTPHVASLKSTRMAIDMLHSGNFDRDRIKLVVNATQDASGDLTPQMKEMLGLEVFWSIPYDPKIPLAAQLGTPVVIAKDQSKAGNTLAEMALALTGATAHRQQAQAKDMVGAIIGRVSSKLSSGTVGD